jgi:hypothetical protein
MIVYTLLQLSVSKIIRLELRLGDCIVVRNIFRELNLGTKCKSYAFDIELLTIASLLNLHVKEIPIKMK